jgi:hypothetical protein
MIFGDIKGQIIVDHLERERHPGRASQRCAKNRMALNDPL